MIVVRVVELRWLIHEVIVGSKIQVQGLVVELRAARLPLCRPLWSYHRVVLIHSVIDAR